jgi:hypothetical protein
VLDADEFLTVVDRDCVPDRDVISGKMPFVGAGQRIVAREGLGEAWDRIVDQVEDRALDCPSQRLWESFDLLPGQLREADKAITRPGERSPSQKLRCSCAAPCVEVLTTDSRSLITSTEAWRRRARSGSCPRDWRLSV